MSRTPTLVARLLTGDFDYEPNKPVRIVGCELGQSNYCQQLANQLQSTVMCYTVDVGFGQVNSFAQEHPILAYSPLTWFLGQKSTAVVTANWLLRSPWPPTAKVFPPNGPPVDVTRDAEEEDAVILRLARMEGLLPSTFGGFRPATGSGPSTPGPSRSPPSQ